MIDPATDAYYVYHQGSLDQIGGSCPVGHCRVAFDEIKGLLAQTQAYSGFGTIAQLSAHQWQHDA